MWMFAENQELLRCSIYMATVNRTRLIQMDTVAASLLVSNLTKEKDGEGVNFFVLSPSIPGHPRYRETFR